MDSFSMDSNLYEVDEMWENDDFESISMGDSFTGDPDWGGFLDHGPPTVVLNDRMITDALHSPRTVTSSSDHSYSLVSNDCEMNPDSPHDEDPRGGLDDFDKDLESECFPAIPLSAASSHNGVYIKQEPMSAPSSPQAHRKSQSLLKQPTIILATRPNRNNLLPKVNIKVENSAGSPGFALPPTPPSSTSSDSEGSLSPDHVLQPVSPPSNGRQRQQGSSSSKSSSHASSNHSSLISSQPKGATGTLILTEEEKRTLLAEGYPIPSRLPLSKAEEKSLKKIRRKIKNKISAQESRRKKKEYMDALEKKVEMLNTENTDYKKRVDSLENSNKSLMSQLHKLQALVGGVTGRPSRNASTQTSSIMMVVLCFAMCVGCWGITRLATSPFTATPEVSSFAMTADSLAPPLCLSSSSDPYATPSKRSRLLMAFLDEELENKLFVSSSDSLGVEVAAPSHVTSDIENDNQQQQMQNASSTTFQAYIKPLNASA